MRHFMSAGIVGLAAAGACAQKDSATWLWDVSTPNGDAIVEPGETATITLSVLMDVDAGGAPIALFGSIFDTLGGNQADVGNILGWEVLSDLADMFGDVTTTDGISLFGTYVAQCFFPNFVPCTDDNPIDVLSFHWDTDDYSRYSVDFATSTKALQVTIDPMGDQQVIDVPVNEASITFLVVPAPAAVALIGLSVFGPRRPVRHPGPALS